MSGAAHGFDDVAKAAELLRRGGVVVFPTETVYGLGADATNAAAIAKIFSIKGRPSTNPLIVHIADEESARRQARDWPEIAQKLAQAFWPGPLTLVVPSAEHIVSAVTAGRDTVGLRAPDHPLALQLLREFGGPLAAPSANRSNRVSPTTAEHVRRELGDRVDLILDGGACRVGIESTVVDVSGDIALILRPGGVDRESIEKLIGPVMISRDQAGAGRGESVDGADAEEAIAAPSPGRQPVHYSPTAPAFRFERGEAEKFRKWCGDHGAAAVTILLLGPQKWIESDESAAALKRSRVVAMPGNPADYARQLYARLHEADYLGSTQIFIEIPPDEPAWQAIRDRLIRATRPLAAKPD